MLSAIKVDALLEISTDDVMSINSPSIKTLLATYLTSSKPISAGVKLKLRLPIKDLLQKMNAKVSSSDIPSEIAVTLMISKSGIELQFSDSFTMNLLKLLSIMVPQLQSGVFGNVFKTIPKIAFDEFKVDVQTKSVDIVSRAVGAVKAANGLFTIADAKFDISVKKNGEWDFAMSGKSKFKVRVCLSKVLLSHEERMNSRKNSNAKVSNHFVNVHCIFILEV